MFWLSVLFLVCERPRETQISDEAKSRTFLESLPDAFFRSRKEDMSGDRGRLVTLYKWSNMHPTLTVSPCDTHPTHSKVFLKVGSSDISGDHGNTIFRSLVNWSENNFKTFCLNVSHVLMENTNLSLFCESPWKRKVSLQLLRFL